MRCYALAEAAIEMKAKVLVALAAPSTIDWPCPVVMDNETGSIGNITIGVLVVDGVEVPAQEGVPGQDRAEYWSIIDSVPDGSMYADGYIYPHFGATPIPGYPTFYGPQWMPLRKGFRIGNSLVGTMVGTYRHEQVEVHGGDHYSVSLEQHHDMAWALSRCSAVIVPPSTIAYEAMALNVHVNLHDAVKGYEHIATAMIEAKVAHMFTGPIKTVKSGDSVRFNSRVDGRGAIRLLEALL